MCIVDHSIAWPQNIFFKEKKLYIFYIIMLSLC